MVFVRRLLGLSVLAGALLACDGHAADKPAAPVATLQVFTYNVLADEVHVRERVPELLRILRDSEADVIALQEVAPWFAKTLLREDWTAAYQRATQDGRTLVAREFIILSRFPVVDYAIIMLPSHQRRIAFCVTLEIDGVQTAVATTHLDSLLKDGPIRARQLDAIFAHLAKFEEAIFLGDLNFGDGEQPDSVHLPPEYRDAWLALRSEEQGFTWDIEKSPWARRESFPGEPSRRLDRIFMKSTRWTPTSVTIIGDQPVPGKRKDLFPSDHFGLIAEFSRVNDGDRRPVAIKQSSK